MLVSSVIIGAERGDIHFRRSSVFDLAPEMRLTRYSVTIELLFPRNAFACSALCVFAAEIVQIFPLWDQ